MTPAETAKAEFLRLLRGAPAAIAAGKISRDDAEDRLQCWLAIACRAGADLPQLDALGLPSCREGLRFPGRVPFTVPEHQARAFCADGIAARSQWEPELAQARYRALEADPNSERTRAIYELADALGVSLRASAPAQIRKVA